MKARWIWGAIGGMALVVGCGSSGDGSNSPPIDAAPLPTDGSVAPPDARMPTFDASVPDAPVPSPDAAVIDAMVADAAAMVDTMMAPDTMMMPADAGEPDTAPPMLNVVVPRTGQTTCFDAAGSEVACGGTAHDGELQAGRPWPQPRFRDNQDGTITDRVSGLMWLTDANCIASQYANVDNDTEPSNAGDGRVSWQTALAFVAGLNDGTYPNCAAGHDDWHLPNINELGSLANYEVTSLATWLTTQGFTNVGSGVYWTSSTQVSVPSNLWSLNMTSMQMGGWGKATSNWMVWPVRIDDSETLNVAATQIESCWDAAGGSLACAGTGQDGDVRAGKPVPSPRFVDNGDGTVTDRKTELTWLKDVGCLLANHAQFDGDGTADGQTDWQSALDAVARINDGTYASCTGGHNDWRLPNINEMLSLMDWSARAPALTPGHPFTNVAAGYYWTSTTAGARANAWGILLHSGFMNQSNKTSGRLRLWPVR